MTKIIQLTDQEIETMRDTLTMFKLHIEHGTKKTSARNKKTCEDILIKLIGK